MGSETRKTAGLPWIFLDLETTGLDQRQDQILECAAFAVDPLTLEVLQGPVVDMVLTPLSYNMCQVVWDMHTANGLIAQIKELTRQRVFRTETTLDFVLEDLLRTYGGGQKLPLAGNSVHFDLGFLKEHCPNAAKLLSHRVVDVSVYRETFRAWGLPVPEGVVAHRAMADAESSLAQLRHFHGHLRGERQRIAAASEAAYKRGLGDGVDRACGVHTESGF